MNIGIPKEVKNREYRVGATPGCVAEYKQAGHRVLVECGAGQGAGFSDQEYLHAGAELVADHAALFDGADMIVKVKEPVPAEYDLLRPGQVLYTYLHLAAVPDLAMQLIEKQVTAVAYETIALDDGRLPCLAPMSAIAGKLSVQQAAKYLECSYGGRGVLLGGVPGVDVGRVVVLGAGSVGQNAAKVAIGMGADVTVLDIAPDRLKALDDQFGGRVHMLYSNATNLRAALNQADVVIGAVLVAGARAPTLIRRDDLAGMKPGAVIVDVAVDQGGCVQTTQPTTHDDPIFIENGIVHYCVTNMPAAVARTATLALTMTTLPYGLQLAQHGVPGAFRESAPLRCGLNVWQGHITHPAVAQSLGLPVQALAA